MTYDFSTRLDRLGTRMKDLHDNELTYTRSGSTAITIENFTPEKLNVNNYSMAGVTLLQEQVQDFVFDTSELSSLSPSTPKVGDTLVWGSWTFTVIALKVDEGMEEVFLYTTSSRNRLRVHTKQTA